MAEPASPSETPPKVPDYTVFPREIGRGSYGSIYLAQNVMGTWRAVKVVYRQRFDHDAPFEREWRAIQRFDPVSRSHPSQVSILHIGRNDVEGFFYYVMDLADDEAAGTLIDEPGGEARVEPASRPGKATQLDPEQYVPRTLRGEIDRRGRLPLEECLSISMSLATALDHLHRNDLVHRDVKPVNIVFVHGIAKLADPGSVTGFGARSFAGTMDYLPPEGPGTPGADVYSLGKVIYEMMTGLHVSECPALPPDFGDWPDHPRWVELNRVLEQATESRPNHRYLTAAELFRDLQRVQMGESPNVARIRKLRKTLWLGMSGTALALMIAVGIGLHLYKLNKASERSNLIRSAQLLRTTDHEDSWTSQALSQLRDAGKIRVDDELRTHAMATFAMPDARLTLRFTNSPAKHFAFDRSGKLLLVDGGGSVAPYQWNLPDNAKTALIHAGGGPVWFATNGHPCQLTHRGGGTFAVTDLNTGSTIRVLTTDSPKSFGDIKVIAVAVSPDFLIGAAAIADTRTNLTVLWDLQTGIQIGAIPEAHTTLAISPNADCVATGDAGGRVRVLLLPSLAEWTSFRDERGAIHCLAFSKDRRVPEEGTSPHPWLLAVGGLGGKIHIHGVAERKRRTICLGSPFRVDSLAISPDGMTLASGGHREVRFWDIASGQLLALSAWDNADALVFSPNGVSLAVNRVPLHDRDPPQIGIIEYSENRGVRRFRGLTSGISRIKFSPDGGRLAALAHNWQVAVWNTAERKLDMMLEVPTGISADNASIAFSRDGTQLAYATSSAAALWEISTGNCLRRWSLPQGYFQHLSFDDSGRLVHFQWERNGPSRFGLCRIRNLLQPDASAQPLDLPVLEGPVVSATLSSDGRFVGIAHGLHTPNQRTVVMNVFETVHGHSIPPSGQPISSEHFQFDSTSSLFACFDSQMNKTRCFSMPEWQELAGLPDAVEALGRHGSIYLTKNWELRRSNDPEWRLSLGLANSPRSNQFSPTASAVAVGTTDGTVFLYGIREITDQLKSNGLGW